MIGGEAVIGWSNGTSVIHDVRLASHKPATFVNVTSEIPLYNSSVCHNADGWTILKFTRPVKAGLNPISSDVKVATPVIMAFGPQAAFSWHHDNKQPALIDLVNNTKSDQKPPKPLNPAKVAHGILMTVAWGAILPIGILFPRFGKDFGGDLWFKVHRLLQVLGYIVCLAGFLTILIQHILVADTHFDVRISVSCLCHVLIVHFFFIRDALHNESFYRIHTRRLDSPS
jgi:hypothetical protein